MIGIFRQKNPGNAFLLFLFALGLKFPLFLHPGKPVLSLGDNYLYIAIVGLLDPFAKNATIVYSVITFLLLFTQATLLNRISNSLKLFPKSNYLVGMSFLLVTSLMKEWTSFSAIIIVNSLMVWIWYRMIGLYNNDNPKTSLYNVSALVGLVTLVYSPAVAFVLLLFLAIVITRPMRITEWLVSLLGLLTPYYFLLSILFLRNQWHPEKILPGLSFHLPRLPASFWVIASVILLILPFFIGGYFVQVNLHKMLIHVRKAWGLLLLFMVVGILIIFINPGNSYLHWMLIAVPVAAFHASTYYYSSFRWMALLLYWGTFIFAIVLNYSIYP